MSRSQGYQTGIRGIINGYQDKIDLWIISGRFRRNIKKYQMNTPKYLPDISEQGSKRKKLEKLLKTALFWPNPTIKDINRISRPFLHRISWAVTRWIDSITFSRGWNRFLSVLRSSFSERRFSRASANCVVGYAAPGRPRHVIYWGPPGPLALRARRRRQRWRRRRCQQLLACVRRPLGNTSARCGGSAARRPRQAAVLVVEPPHRSSSWSRLDGAVERGGETRGGARRAGRPRPATRLSMACPSVALGPERAPPPNAGVISDVILEFRGAWSSSAKLDCYSLFLYT